MGITPNEITENKVNQKINYQCTQTKQNIVNYIGFYQIHDQQRDGDTTNHQDNDRSTKQPGCCTIP